MGTILHLRLSLFFALFAASSAAAAERIDARAWRGVKTYEMQTLQKLEPLPIRGLVGVRFNYRDQTIRHLKPNWFQGSIWSHRREEKDEFDYIQVMVSKADLPAFQSIPTDFRAGGKFVVYGQVLRDQEADYIFLRLLGTKVQQSKGGRVTVSW